MKASNQKPSTSKEKPSLHKLEPRSGGRKSSDSRSEKKLDSDVLSDRTPERKSLNDRASEKGLSKHTSTEAGKAVSSNPAKRDEPEADACTVKPVEVDASTVKPVEVKVTPPAKAAVEIEEVQPATGCVTTEKAAKKGEERQPSAEATTTGGTFDFDQFMLDMNLVGQSGFVLWMGILARFWLLGCLPFLFCGRPAVQGSGCLVVFRSCVVLASLSCPSFPLTIHLHTFPPSLALFLPHVLCTFFYSVPFLPFLTSVPYPAVT